MAKMQLWTASQGAGGPIINSEMEGISVTGDYIFLRSDLQLARPFMLGAKVKVAGHTGTIQLFGTAAGAKANIGAAITPVNGTPVVGTDEYTLTGQRGITVSALTGTVYIEVGQ